MHKIICVGSSSKDIFFPTKEGVIIDTPEDVMSQKKLAFELGAKYQVKERYESIGGCAANVSVGLARLGEQVSCCTKVGDDDIGKWIKKIFAKEGVGMETLEEENGCKSDLSMLIVDMNTGEKIPFSDRDANEKLVIYPEKLQSAHWIAISSLNGDWENNLNKLLELAQEKKIRIAFNPGQKNIKTGLDSVTHAITRSDLFFVNKDEAIEIVNGLGEITLRELLESEEYLSTILHRLGAKVVVITDGERGAWGFDGRNLLHVQALLKKAVDTTGAGDAFTSGFLAAYLKKMDLATALKWGIANSSSSVMEYGGTKGLLDQDEIVKIISKIEVEILK